jgi:hypothetical protein
MPLDELDQWLRGLVNAAKLTATIRNRPERPT